MIRQENGRTVKENPEIKQKLENNVTAYKVALDRGARLSTLIDHPGWLCAQEILTERIKFIDGKLKQFKINDQRINDLLLQERETFLTLINIVDDHVQSMSGFQSAIERSEKELESRKQLQGV